MNNVPKHLFSMPLILKPDSIVEKVPRRFASEFNIVAARLGDLGSEFLFAIALGRPTISLAKALIRAVAKVDSRNVAVYWPYMDIGMMKGLASEGVPYVVNESNVFLPFLGMAISPVPTRRVPRSLSPHSQRIVLNLIAGKWDGLSAGELAKAAGVSASTMSGCLAEIEAILPSLIHVEWKRRILRNPGLSRELLLDAFDPFFVSPVRKRWFLSSRDSLDVLKRSGALLAGETALSYYSDLARDCSVTCVAVCRGAVSEIIETMGDAWRESEWYESPAVIVEEWAYGLDGKNSVSRNAEGFDSLSALFLYVEMKDVDQNDVRLADAVAQLREVACLQ